jgi:subtilisin family serine protease
MDGNTAYITIAGDLAVKKGIVVVNSAGNNGFNPVRNTLGAPADGDSIIAAGAIRSNGERSGFSSVGNTVDGRIKPDFMAMGSGVVTASSNFPDGYTLSSGTSFSCPLIAGIIALMISNNPQLTPMEIIEVLRNTSSHASNPNREYGYGIIDAYAAVNATTVGISTIPELPADFNLYQNYPNPFNPTTRIRFELAHASDIKLILYNALGEKVRVLLDENRGVGSYEYLLNGSGLSSGVYYMRLIAGDHTKSIKMTLLK